MYKEEEVRRGIALLNEEGPADWHYKLRKHRLDLQNEDNCILGQLYDDYVGGVDLLFGEEFSESDACNHGFDLQRGEDVRINYLELTKTWLTLIDEEKVPESQVA